MTETPGYVLAWRSKWNHPIFRRKQEAAVWAWMCETAQWQDYRMSTKFGPVNLKRGELIIAERELAEDFGLHRNTLRTLIQRMIDDGMITLIRDRAPHRAGTVVSIVKYEQYQQFDARASNSRDRKETDGKTEERPKEDRNWTKNNEDNSSNEDNEIPPPSPQGEEPDLFPVEQDGTTSRPVGSRKFGLSDAEVEEKLQEFKSVYPRRNHPHTWGGKSGKGANAKFKNHVRKGVNPDLIINAARKFAAAMQEDRVVGTRSVPDALTWLNQERWTEWNNVHHLPSASLEGRRELAESTACYDNESMEQWRERTYDSRMYR